MNNQSDQTIDLDGNIKTVEMPVIPTGVLPSTPNNENPAVAPVPPVNEVNPVNTAQPAVDSSNPQNFIKPIEVIPDDVDLLSSVPKPDIMISAPQDTSIDTDVLIVDYVGENYEKISTKPINFSALFFGISYMLYRKMYLEGGAALVIAYILFYVLLLVNPLVAPLIFLIISIVLFVLFNTIYIKLSKKKIDKIKNRYKVMSVSELKKLCQKKGGKNLVVPIVASILVPAVMGGVMTTLLPVDSEEIVNKIKDTLSNIKLPSGSKTSPQGQQPTEKKDNVSLETISKKQDVTLADKIDMQYLTVFKPTANNTTYMYDYVRYTTPEDENTACSFNLSVVDGYESGTQLINDLASTYGVSSSTLTTSAGITWNIIKIENDNETINVAASSNNSEVYMFTYKISKGADQSLANTWNNGVIQSIEFK